MSTKKSTKNNIHSFFMENELKKQIGGRIRQVRYNLGLTQYKMSAYFDISKDNYSKIEEGKIFPNSGFLNTLKRQFNISLDWLISAEGEMVGRDGQEIDDLLFYVRKVPMIRHKVLGFFLEYKLKNKNSLKRIVKKYRKDEGEQKHSGGTANEK